MGGGGSKARSKVEIENNSLIVNQTDINIVNKNIVDTTVNTIIKRANDATATLNNTQVVDMSGGFVYGDFEPGAVEQDIKGQLNFQTLQKDAVRTDIIMDVMNKLQDTLNRNISNDILDKMNANAASDQKSGFMGGFGSGGGNSEADTKIVNHYTNINTTRKSLNQEMITKLVNNFSQETVNKCIATVNNSQYVNYSNKIVYGNFKPGFIKQSIATDLIANCLQTSETAQQITKQIAAATGVSIVDNSSTTKKTDLSATATAVQKNTGPIEEVGNAISDIVSAVPRAIFGGLGSAFNFKLPGLPGMPDIPGLPSMGGSNPSASSSQSSSSCIFCIICMIVIKIVIGLIPSGGGDDGNLKYRKIKY